MAAPFVVGIDLGTTHSCVAWTDAGAPIEVLPIEQLVPLGRERRSTLPSVLYAPLAEEGVHDPLASGPFIVGELARSRGAEVPGRAITSAKSWLSHASLAPDTFMLPAGAPAGSPRLTPIDASARILEHLARAFESTTRRRLDDAAVVLTLPASFDEGARAATLEAAHRAGLRVSLLEEPQAAFYDFMAKDGALSALLGKKKSEAYVLVVDVGGGTTDLSLACVAQGERGISVTRVATGDHLLLGGDNMDLALAALVATRLPDELRDDPFVAAQLVQRVRVAKEALLGDDASPNDSHAIAITKDRGARLVGGTVTVRVTRREVRALMVDGFFPALDEGPLPRPKRAALVARGLPFERDTAITRHVARFLQRYAEGRAPDAVLLNGGVFRARAFGAALTASLRGWLDAKVPLLSGTDPDLAVARGAARYGVLRASGGERIRAGAPRSYYVGVEGPGGAPRAVCVVPRGTLEGEPCRLAGPTLKLRTGEPSRFDLYRARTGVVHAPGAVVEPTEKAFARLRPLVTAAKGGPGLVDVVLAGELTPVGTLELSLREVGGRDRTFALAFHVREPRDKKASERRGDDRASIATEPRHAETTKRVRSPELRSAEAAIAQTFSFAQKTTDAAQTLTRRLEGILGDRLGWSLSDSRDLFDVLLEQRGARRWTAEHERAFWSLAGLTLRPGFGAPGDDARTRALFALFAPRMTFGERAPVAQSFYVAWRRVAAGLDRSAQEAIFDALAPLLEAPRPPVAEVELRELLSWLERVPASKKIPLGDRIVAAAGEKLTGRALDDVARLAARVPVYADESAAVPPGPVEAWISRVPLADESERRRVAIAQAIVQMARLTDTARDLSPKTRRRVAAALQAAGVARELVLPLTTHVPITKVDRSTRYGEALPPGLVLE